MNNEKGTTESIPSQPSYVACKGAGAQRRGRDRLSSYGRKEDARDEGLVPARGVKNHWAGLSSGCSLCGGSHQAQMGSVAMKGSLCPAEQGS